jgi:hypothetical protein
VNGFHLSIVHILGLTGITFIGVLPDLSNTPSLVDV